MLNSALLCGVYAVLWSAQSRLRRLRLVFTTADASCTFSRILSLCLTVCNTHAHMHTHTAAAASLECKPGNRWAGSHWLKSDKRRADGAGGPPEFLHSKRKRPAQPAVCLPPSPPSSSSFTPTTSIPSVTWTVLLLPVPPGRLYDKGKPSAPFKCSIHFFAAFSRVSCQFFRVKSLNCGPALL